MKPAFRDLWEASMQSIYSNHFALFFIPLIFIMLLSLALFILVLWSLIDVLRNEFTGNNKIIWLLVIILLPPLGSVLYIFIGREQKIQPDKKHNNPEVTEE
jgi:hypothetical protein